MIGFYLMIAAILGYYLGCVNKDCSLKKQYKFVFFSGVFMAIFEMIMRSTQQREVNIVVSEDFLEKVQKLAREGKTVKFIADELKISYARAITYIRKIDERITEQEEQLFDNVFKNTGKKFKVRLKNGEDLAFLEKFEYFGKIKIMPLEQDGCYEIEKIGG